MSDVEAFIAKLCEAEEETLRHSVNPLADLYRCGADLRTLLPLLVHSDARVVECGAWIASEVVHQSRGREIFSELSHLIDHQDPAVRYWVVESVALLLRPEDRKVTRQWILLVVDANLAVRRQALFYLCLMPDSIIESLQDTDEWRSAHLLLSGTGRDAILSTIKSESLFDRRMAVAAAMRNYGSDREFVQNLLPLLDSEVTDKLPTLPKNKKVCL